MPSTSTSSRPLALTILGEVLGRGKFASDRMNHYLTVKKVSPPDRALLTQLVYGVLREKGFLDHALSVFLTKSKTPPFVENLLRLGAFQILFLEKIPDHAAVFEMVEIAKKKSGVVLGQLVNAVLRRVQEGREKLIEERGEVLAEFEKNPTSSREDLEKLSWALSFPPWIMQRWINRYQPPQVLEMGKNFNNVPPYYLRVNQLKTSPEEILPSLSQVGIQASRVGMGPMIQVKKYDEALKTFFQDGLLSMQDLASYRVVEALEVQKDEIGLDACAGHGGKAAAMSEILGPGGKFFVHDSSPTKVQELVENFSRLGLSSPKVLANSQDAQEKGLLFDWILVDAPCSGTGTLGRKPEIRWRLRSEDLARYSKKQIQILGEWWPMLKPGGRLLYAVCSLEPEEGGEVMEAFLRDHPEANREEFLTTLPSPEPQDGFFICRLEKK